MDVEAINILLRDLNLDPDDENRSQSAILAGASDSEPSNDDDSLTCIIDGTEYVEAKKIACQPRKGKKSSVWKLGIELKNFFG